jgi:hypothetical protein
VDSRFVFGPWIYDEFARMTRREMVVVFKRIGIVFPRE